MGISSSLIGGRKAGGEKEKPMHADSRRKGKKTRRVTQPGDRVGKKVLRQALCEGVIPRVREDGKLKDKMELKGEKPQLIRSLQRKTDPYNIATPVKCGKIANPPGREETVRDHRMGTFSKKNGVGTLWTQNGGLYNPARKVKRGLTVIKHGLGYEAEKKQTKT